MCIYLINALILQLRPTRYDRENSYLIRRNEFMKNEMKQRIGFHNKYMYVCIYVYLFVNMVIESIDFQYFL